MSTTYPVWQLTNYPDSLDKANANVRQGIVNFEDRTSSTDPMLYYVLANDVKTLQQAMFAVQETLGVRPQSTYNTVDLRIAALEDYADLDARYGGITWKDIAEADRPTILSHLHDGSSTGAPKINLASHVTGTLPKANMNLSRTSGGLTAEDIALGPTTDQTIANKFNDKLDKTGGVIQGTNAYLTVSGNFNSRIYKEADAYSCTATVGEIIADTDAFSGTARRVRSTHADGYALQYNSSLRYGDYSLALRMKVSSKTPLQSVGKVRVYSGSTLVKEIDVIPNSFSGTDYEMFYIAFTHKGNPTVNVHVTWYGTSIVPAIACDLTIDSLVITPVHVTTYDME